MKEAYTGKMAKIKLRFFKWINIDEAKKNIIEKIEAKKI